MVDTETLKDFAFFATYGIIASAIAFFFLFSSPLLGTDKNFIYFSVFSVALPLILIGFFQFTKEQSWRKKGFFSIPQPYLHDPEKSIMKIVFGESIPKFIKNLYEKKLVLIWLSITFALIIGLLSTTNLFSVGYGLPDAVNKVSDEIGKIYLAGENVASFETLLMQSFLLGCFFGLAKLVSKGNKAIFVLLMILFVIVNSGIAVFYHQIAYQNDEQGLWNIFKIFLFYNGITALTGSIIFPLVVHPLINMLIESQTLFAQNEGLLIGVLITLSILWMLSSIIFFTRTTKSKEAHEI